MADDYEQQCQLRMETALNSVRANLQMQDQAIAEIRRVQAEHARRLEEGTQIMRGMDTKINALTESTTSLATSTRPIIDAMQVMQTGIVMLSRFGDFCTRVGARLARSAATFGEWGWKIAKFGSIAFFLWIFFRALWLGQNFSSAWADLLRNLK